MALPQGGGGWYVALVYCYCLLLAAPTEVSCVNIARMSPLPPMCHTFTA